MLLFHFALLAFGSLKHALKFLTFYALFFLLLLVLLLGQKLIVFHPDVLEFFELLPSLLFCLFEFEIDCFFFLLFAFHLRLLLPISHVQSRLILLYFIKLLSVLFLHLDADLVLKIILFLHGLVVLFLLLFFLSQSPALLFNQLLHLLIHNLLLF